jgi:hypothetical protein
MIHAMLGIVEAGIIGGCHNATADGLKVYPPNGRGQLRRATPEMGAG